MGKCYILGAGFSKAVSNLPVMKDLAKTFWDIRNQENQLGHNNRVAWGDKIREYLLYLETELFVKPCINTKNGDIYKECNFHENLEALISFIELNISGEIKARVTEIEKYQAKIQDKNTLAKLEQLMAEQNIELAGALAKKEHTAIAQGRAREYDNLLNLSQQANNLKHHI